MNSFLAAVRQVGEGLVLITPLSATDPGYGNRPPVDPGYGRPDWGPVDPGWGTRPPVDPGYGQGGGFHPGNALPIPPVRPSQPIVLPPGIWPPVLPPGVDNTLPPAHGHPSHPIVIPPDPSIGIEHPIVLPQLPPGSALLIALPQATPKDAPPNTKPAILYQGAGTKPVLVYVSAAATPK